MLLRKTVPSNACKPLRRSFRTCHSRALQGDARPVLKKDSIKAFRALILWRNVARISLVHPGYKPDSKTRKKRSADSLITWVTLAVPPQTAHTTAKNRMNNFSISRFKHSRKTNFSRAFPYVQVKLPFNLHDLYPKVADLPLCCFKNVFEALILFSYLDRRFFFTA